MAEERDGWECTCGASVCNERGVDPLPCNVPRCKNGAWTNTGPCDACAREDAREAELNGPS